MITIKQDNKPIFITSISEAETIFLARYPQVFMSYPPDSKSEIMMIE